MCTAHSKSAIIRNSDELSLYVYVAANPPTPDPACLPYVCEENCVRSLGLAVMLWLWTRQDVLCLSDTFGNCESDS